MTLRRTPYDPDCVWDRGIRDLIYINAFFEFCGIFFWSILLTCMVIWPTGKDFRLAFERPPFVLYYVAAGFAGAQV